MRNQHCFPALLLLAILAGPPPVLAQIPTQEKMLIDFPDTKVARQNAEWQEAEGLDITQRGLGFDGPKLGTLDPNGWVLAHPLAVGLAWRPPSSVQVNVKISFDPWSDQIINIHLYSSSADAMFVRYSPDCKHWSSWQELEVDTPKKGETFLKFHGNVGVPRRNWIHYKDLCLAYMKMDVPWGSDEEAAVRWIVGRQSDFFAKEMPFVGYVQVLYETTFESGERIRSIQTEASATLSGLSAVPKDPTEITKHTGPWRYVSP